MTQVKALGVIIRMNKGKVIKVNFPSKKSRREKLEGLGVMICDHVFEIYGEVLTNKELRDVFLRAAKHSRFYGEKIETLERY